jgi:lysophospholipase L1-like esterase
MEVVVRFCKRITCKGLSAILAGLALALFLAGCDSTTQPDPAGQPPTEPALPPSILALGDSYTKGESVPTAWSWPRQLADSLAAAGDTLQDLRVIAETGWTTRDLLTAVRFQRASLDSAGYGLVTLMIGVNNQFQHLDRVVFAAEMDTLIDLAVQLAAGNADRVLGFSIPDYGATPVGGLYGAETISEDLALFNAILQQKYGAAGITMLDVTSPSLLVTENPALVSRDGLHYSGEMYRIWVELMLPEVRAALNFSS